MRERVGSIVMGVNSSIGLVSVPKRNYFSQNTPFSIFQLFVPPFFNFFPLGDLKPNLRKNLF